MYIYKYRHIKTTNNKPYDSYINSQFSPRN